jgi:hypothetical protein
VSTLHLTLDEPTRSVITEAYRAFNAREMDAALATMQSNVEWPNGMEGGTVCGHGGVRDYWTRQWGMINPHVDPIKVDADGHGRIVVGVHQVIRDLDGKVLMDRMVEHVYSFEDGLIRSMEIRD